MAVVAVDLSAQSASSPKSVRLIAGSPVLNSLSISGPTSVNVGQTAQYMVQATDANGRTVGVGAVWSTSNSGLATINQSGVLTAVAAGTVTVQATFQGLTAQFSTTLASTTSSSTYGPQRTITCPSGAIDIWPGQSIQSTVNGYAGATTFCLRAGVHGLTSSITPKTGNTFVGEYGAILDGTNWSTTDATQAAFRAHNQDIDYVTIRNLVIRNMPQRGIHAYYYMADNWTIENNEIGPNKDVGLVFGGSATIKNNYIHHNTYSGYMGPYAHNATLEGNEIAYNGWQQKVMESANVTFRNNFVHHNTGAGIWFDSDNTGTLVEGNRVEDNGNAGVWYEIGSGVIIRNNSIRRNADTGVFISTSKNAQIYNNTLEDNFRGITYFVNCPSVGGGLIGFDLANNAAYDNTIIVGTQSGALASVFSYASCTTAQVAPYANGSKNLTFYRNTYRVPSPTTVQYWHWNGFLYWSGWQAVPQDAGSTVSQ